MRFYIFRNRTRISGIVEALGHQGAQARLCLEFPFMVQLNKYFILISEDSISRQHSMKRTKVDLESLGPVSLFLAPK
jgi:hypothetical protein